MWYISHVVLVARHPSLHYKTTGWLGLKNMEGTLQLQVVWLLVLLGDGCISCLPKSGVREYINISVKTHGYFREIFRKDERVWRGFCHHHQRARKMGLESLHSSVLYRDTILVSTSLTVLNG